mmetsp:Transcript_4491/g.17208  ORF Transcript_4491/g.17208 Transcript_4491/m.17208 type:complete len:221 (-) Transcript_4491:2185-2847(-)
MVIFDIEHFPIFVGPLYIRSKFDSIFFFKPRPQARTVCEVVHRVQHRKGEDTTRAETRAFWEIYFRSYLYARLVDRNQPFSMQRRFDEIATEFQRNFNNFPEPKLHEDGFVESKRRHRVGISVRQEITIMKNVFAYFFARYIVSHHETYDGVVDAGQLRNDGLGAIHESWYVQHSAWALQRVRRGIRPSTGEIESRWIRHAHATHGHIRSRKHTARRYGG